MKKVFEKSGFVCFNRSLIFLKLDLNDIPSCPEGINHFNILTENDIQKEHQYNDGFFSREQAITRITVKRNRLFVVKNGKTIVFYLWVEGKNASAWWFDNLPFNLAQDMAYVSGAYTLPEYRGKRIAYNSKKEIFNHLRKGGIKYLFEVVHPNNSIALKIDKTLGFKEYQTVHYRRYWHIRYYNVIKFDSNANRSYISVFRHPKDIWRCYLDEV